MDPKCDRELTLYGWLRGCNMKPGARVHLAGVGDFSIHVGGEGCTGVWRSDWCVRCIAWQHRPGPWCVWMESCWME